MRGWCCRGAWSRGRLGWVFGLVADVSGASWCLLAGFGFGGAEARGAGQDARCAARRVRRRRRVSHHPASRIVRAASTPRNGSIGEAPGPWMISASAPAAMPASVAMITSRQGTGSGFGMLRRRASHWGGSFSQRPATV